MNKVPAIIITVSKQPIGDLYIAATSKGVLRIGFSVTQSLQQFTSSLNAENNSGDGFPFPGLLGKLDRYFRGEKTVFDEPLDLPSATTFQRQVWDKVGKIPYGTVKTYAQIAREIGNPHAVRAVGRANGANPVPILIPCHRVITGAGHLGGYSAGLAVKDALLRLEGAVI